jgi:phosphoglycerol transferase MdoB-like AlkP superfamily enzyme
MKRKLFSLLVLLVTAVTGAWAQTTYTVAGNNPAMFGTAWDPTNTANDMTKNGDGTYSITYTNV